MTILKCKMCGGDIEAATNQTYGTCDHCGSTMTLPKATDEQITNLFNRANHFRRQNDFDKAMMAYDNILNIDASSAEAHWGLVLSKYGIEYVEDPQSHERVPTCHRVQSDSILTDSDYLSSTENAEDSYTKDLYESEAKRIAEIQRDILSISLKEKPYDVFICYKETTDSGSRTKDSAMAQDVYYQLTNEGYKAFFARITLEGKLGQQYEPYIFAALNSAKVMIVIGTRQEHFNATWVKNEWSRYLALIKKDRSKLLIPCYSDMDAYDLPEELSMLQSQDMARIGFIQDLIRGIKKVLDIFAMKTDNLSLGNGEMSAMAPGVAQLLERASLFLEDGNFQSADEYCNRILDLEPRNAQAYFYKLLVSLKLHRSEDILSHSKPLDEYLDYQKAVRFADDGFKTTIENYHRNITERLKSERLIGIYKKASDKMQNAKTEEEYLAAANLFDSIDEYKNSNNNANLCRVSAEEKRKAAVQAREREKRYKEYCSIYSEQLKIHDLIKNLQKDIEELYDILKQTTDDRKYIQKCIRDQEKKVYQYNMTLEKLPILPDFKW